MKDIWELGLIMQEHVSEKMKEKERKDETHSVSNNQFLHLDASLLRPRSRRSRLDELRRFRLQLRVLFDPLHRDHALLQCDESPNDEKEIGRDRVGESESESSGSS